MKKRYKQSILIYILYVSIALPSITILKYNKDIEYFVYQVSFFFVIFFASVKIIEKYVRQ